MNEAMTRNECAKIIQKIEKWQEINSPFHYLYIPLNKELSKWKNQLNFMNEMKLETIKNNVETAYHKSIEWNENTQKKNFYIF